MKLVLDKLLALTLLVALLPVLLIVAIVVYFDQKSIFFIQQRPGLLEKPFYIVKFKTMNDGNESDDIRVTAISSWIRKYSLDELPQLWNVLKGEMSFIGPRPYLMEYLQIYSDDHRKRHWVLPGITGWSQVKGGNHLNWNDKLDLDAQYVDRLSFWLDFKIALKTLFLMVNGKKKDLPDSKFIGYPNSLTNV